MADLNFVSIIQFVIGALVVLVVLYYVYKMIQGVANAEEKAKK